MTSWVKSGVVCECIDQEWHDFFSDQEVPGPLKGERYVVASHQIIDGVLYIQVMGDEMNYEARAFRPVIDEADDLELFAFHLTGSFASDLSPESACLR